MDIKHELLDMEKKLEEEALRPAGYCLLAEAVISNGGDGIEEGGTNSTSDNTSTIHAARNSTARRRSSATVRNRRRSRHCPGTLDLFREWVLSRKVTK